MLNIDTTIDAKTLELQLIEFGMIGINEYKIIKTELLNVNLETEYINSIELFVITSNYEILLERNNKQNIYKVRTINKHSIEDSLLNKHLSNTIEIYE